MNKRKMLLFIIFIGTMIGLRYLGFDRVPFIGKILVLLIVPIYLIWISNKYSKPGRLKKYRTIAYSSAGLWFYIIILTSLLDKYYPKISQEYYPVLRIIMLIFFFASCITIIICCIIIKANEDFSSKY